MEIHIQKCQSCGSRDLRNILVRDEGQKVFVQCRDCEELVARYILSPGGYFHAGKGFESFLRSIERDEEPATARDLHTMYNSTAEDAKEEFKQLLVEAREHYHGDLP